MERLRFFLEEECRIAVLDKQFNIAVEAANCFQKSGYFDDEIYWLIKAEKPFCDCETPENYELCTRLYDVCDRLAILYEHRGQLNKAREQRNIAAKFAPDGVYT